MRINYTLSQGLDVFLSVTADINRTASLAFAILERGETKSDWGQGRRDWSENERQCRGEGQRQQD